jgi:hypothetical protein
MQWWWQVLYLFNKHGMLHFAPIPATNDEFIGYREPQASIIFPMPSSLFPPPLIPLLHLVGAAEDAGEQIPSRHWPEPLRSLTDVAGSHPRVRRPWLSLPHSPSPRLPLSHHQRPPEPRWGPHPSRTSSEIHRRNPSPGVPSPSPSSFVGSWSSGL